MIKIKTDTKIGKAPDFFGKQLGKIQITSTKLADLVGKRMTVVIQVLDENEAKELRGVKNQ